MAMELADIDALITEVKDTIATAKKERAEAETAIKRGQALLKSLTDVRRVLDPEGAKSKGRSRALQQDRMTPVLSILQSDFRVFSVGKIAEMLKWDNGITGTTLSNLVKKGDAVKVGRGLYQAKIYPSGTTNPT